MSHLGTPTREDTAEEYMYHTPVRANDETSVYSNPLSTPRHGPEAPDGAMGSDKEPDMDMEQGLHSAHILPDFDQNARSLSSSISASPEHGEDSAWDSGCGALSQIAEPRSTSALLEAASVAAQGSALPQLRVCVGAELPPLGSTPDRPIPLVALKRASVTKVVTGSTETSDILGFAPEEAICYTIPSAPVSMMSWDVDSEHPNCNQCSTRFSLLQRRHHCRDCGHIFCHGCSNHEITGMQGYTSAVRCCDECFQIQCDREAAGFQARYAKHSSTSVPLEESTPESCVVQ